MVKEATLTEAANQSIRQPTVRKIALSDVREALNAGLADFLALRTDVIFLATIYPVVGLILARIAAGYDMLPLVFPMASGFALVGPFAAIGLYELSRRRERGLPSTFRNAFDVFRAPSRRAIVGLSLLLAAIFVIWLATAMAIYRMIFGDETPASISGFLGEVFTTGPGWLLIVVGTGVGFCFAVVVLTISIVSFPYLIDRKSSAIAAIQLSARAVIANPGVTAAWGIVVAGGLILGSLPFLLGLAVVLPVLGHATWHLYRKMVLPPGADD